MMLQRFHEFNRNNLQFSTKWKHWTLFILILSLGIFARTWRFSQVPPGLIADEASIGVEAFDLSHFGIDRNGISYPVYFIAWGSGQNALYGYLLIPFIDLFGLKAVTVKLPMLISGILTLPLIYWVAYKTFNKRIALISMFFLAISPWHIMLSRLGLESNILPFVFLLGYACLLKSFEKQAWFIAACVLFAVCLYAYVTAYLIIPLFLICSLAILIRGKQMSHKFIAAALASFLVISIPIGLLILINQFRLNSIRLGVLTIPHLPTQPRFEVASGPLANQLFQTLGLNSWNLIKLLVEQYDGLIYNTIAPFGYFYGITFPLAIMGVVLLLLQARKSSNSAKILLLFAWLGAPLIFGILQPANINRINIIFIPILVCMAVAVNWLGEKFKPVLPIAICSFLIAFFAFTVYYHGDSYSKLANIRFHAGLISAIQYASTVSRGPICVTENIDAPYIYVLFAEKPDPETYINSIQYEVNDIPIRQVQSLLQYTFGTKNCSDLPDTVYLLRPHDGFPETGRKYKIEVFGDYLVYTPKQ